MPTAPYSLLRSSNGFSFLSGQLGISPVTKLLVTTSFKDQTVQVLENIKSVLERNNQEMDDIISATVYLTDISYYNELNSIYSSYFSPPFPTRVTVVVAGLPLGADIEISVIADKK